jgi:hypothetical protein
VDRRYSPRFVGEVRCATTGFGSSWKLSGGRAWCSAPTNVSKNRQVRRAINRRARASAAGRGFARTASLERLIQRATKGDITHSARKGRTTGQTSGRTAATTAAAAVASATPPLMRR